MPRKSGKGQDPKPARDESDWYASAQGRRQTQREFERALKNGALIRSAGARVQRTSPDILDALLAQAKANATRPVSIRLPIGDIELARSIAAKRGIGYQTVLKDAIRRGLKRAG